MTRRHVADYELQDNGIGNQRAAVHSVKDANEIRDYIQRAIDSCKDESVLKATKGKVEKWLDANDH